MNNTIRIVCGVGLSLFGGACATVDPKPDYLRTGGHIRAATGVAQPYDPQREDIRERVDDLLENGISAQEAVQICLLNNPGLQSAFLDIGIARADLVQAGLFSNPFLGIATRFPDGGGLANLEAGIAQNLAELWQIPIRKKAAKRELDRAVLRIAREAALLATECKAAYYDAVGADARLEIAEENFSIAKNLLDMALARKQAGTATELDVNLSRSLAIQAELNAAAARLDASDARRRLATLLGLESDAQQWQLIDELPDPPPETLEPERLIAAAKGWRLDLRSARQAVEAAAWRVKEQYRLIFPTVEVGIELEREERRPRSGRNLLADTARSSLASGALTAPEIEPRSARRAEKGQDIIVGPSLGIELPLFDQNQAQIARARYAYEQAIKNLDALERVVTQEVRSAVDRAVTAWRMAQMYRDRSVPLAKRNLALSREAFEAGQASFLTVLEAQRFYLESRRGYIDAARAAAVAIPELERVIGLPFERLGGDIPPPPDAEDDEITEVNP